MPRILVVDDEPDVARVLAHRLEIEGYEMETAGSAEEGLALMQSTPIDLVILDVWLPGMSGFDALATIRERYGASVPVVLLTAYGDPESVSRGREAGADDFLHKPPDSQALSLKVRSLLRMKALHDEALRHREQAQQRVRSLAQLHEIGRDWSLMAQPEEFNRMVTERLATLIGAPVCFIVAYDREAGSLQAALPAHGLSDDVARRLRYPLPPEYRALWDGRTGRPYVSNDLGRDPRVPKDLVRLMGVGSAAAVPMASEGHVLGALVACDKEGGFCDADVQLLSIFAGPAATFLRSRQLFDEQRRHAAGRQRLSEVLGEMAAAPSRSALLGLVLERLRGEFACRRVAFHGLAGSADLSLEAEVGELPDAATSADGDRLGWAVRGATRLQSFGEGDQVRLAVPVRAGERTLGVLDLLRDGARPFDDEEIGLLATLAGQLASGLQRADAAAETERLASQMGTLYELGLETAALRDLRPLFVKATEEAGRLIRADHTSAFRFDPADETLRLFTAWAHNPGRESYSEPVFRLGEGVAGRVAQDLTPALVNDAVSRSEFVPKGNPVSRLICVPLTYFDRERDTLATFGVMNATRRPGAAPFTHDDLRYLMRFASQLSIAVANSMAFESERERSAQLALVNALLKEIAGQLSRERILETAARRIREAFGFSIVVFVRPDRDAGVARIEVASGRQPPPGGFGTFPLSAGVTARVLEDRHSRVLPDVSADPDYLAYWPAVRSEAVVPIVSGDEVVALLIVESEVPRAFDRGLVITLETLADGIGIALRNAELFRALEDTNARLVELDRMKSELVNIVAHDFRAPLSGILGHAELLEWQTEPVAERVVEHARAIVRASTHMASLVDKTLKTMRLDTGHFPFDFALVELGSAVREAVGATHPGPDHTLDADIPDDPIPCWADRDRVLEVVGNLIANALKYSPDGGRVAVRVERHGDEASVQVTDQGIGIAEEDWPRLFKAFSRVRGPRTSRIEGTGLGLYISDRIVRAHGGSLSVDSRPGEGSTFTMRMPVFGPEAQSGEAPILVATADEATRREVRRCLEEAGLAVVEAADGVEAVETAVRLRPRVVVLDTILPRLRTEEVAERLREHEKARSTPMRLVSLSSSPERSGRPGLFDAFVPKPIDRGMLIDAVAAAHMPAPGGG